MTLTADNTNLVIHNFAVSLMAINDTNPADGLAIQQCIEWVHSTYAENLPMASLVLLMKAKYPKDGPQLEQQLNRAIVTALINDTNNEDRHAETLFHYLLANPRALNNLRTHAYKAYINFQGAMVAKIHEETEPSPFCPLMHALLSDVETRDGLYTQVCNSLQGPRHEEALKGLNLAMSLDYYFGSGIRNAFSTLTMANITQMKTPTPQFIRAYRAVFNDDLKAYEQNSSLLYKLFGNVFTPHLRVPFDPQHVDLAFDYLDTLAATHRRPEVPSFQYDPVLEKSQWSKKTLLARLPAALRLVERLNTSYPDTEDYITSHLLNGLGVNAEALMSADASERLKLIGTHMANPENLEFPLRLLCAMVISLSPKTQLVDLFRDSPEVASQIYSIRPIRELLPHMSPKHRREALSSDMEL